MYFFLKINLALQKDQKIHSEILVSKFELKFIFALEIAPLKMFRQGMYDHMIG